MKSRRSLQKFKPIALAGTALILLSFLSGVSSAADYSLKKSETLPFEMRAGYPFIDISIGGVNHNLLVDMTDYRQLTLASKVLEHTPHKVLGTERYGGANDQVFFLKKFSIEEVKLGGLIKTNVKGTEEAFDPNYPTPSPAGAVGAAMFFDGILEFDFQKKLMHVTPNGRMPACEPLASLGIPLVAVATYKGQELTFFLDIAYQYSVIDSGVVWSQQKAQNNHGSELKMPNVFVADKLEFKNFSIDDIRFVPLPMADSGIQGVLGMDVFNRYNLKIDFPNNCFSFPLAQASASKPSQLKLKIPEISELP